MAAATRRSLASRAGAAARRVVSRGASTEAKAAKSAARSVAKTPAKKTAAKKTTAQKSPAKKTAAAKTTAKKAAVTSTTRTATKAPAKKAAEKTVTAQTTPPAKKAPATRAPAKKAPVKKVAQRIVQRLKQTKGLVEPVVLEAEDPWTKAELKEVRAQLNDDVKRLTGELAEVEEDLAGMIANSGEGAGNDQADVGSASFERDQEMVIVNNARDMLEQSEHALERIADGSYGQCEICGNPIGKNRLMAFPRATLCLSCKQREERR